ncbi:PA2169 family four-helix-bundle protein [Variovorax rhizosphaerae]|uniref:PA2169 family four-helix-bundle protein n=1 Tax=Variovorax rhizosphaerae TaxID=1836200 RepID=A0ABU8WSU0_9BURK
MANVQDFPETRDLNRDPITGAPGAHPVGTGVGATGGALAGAAAGAMAGPVGAAVGLVAGAVVGGLGGKAVGERINPTAEDAYWRKSYDTQPYYESGLGYDDYGPAYQLGYTGRGTLGSDWDTVEPTLASRWETDRGTSRLDWPRARAATRAAWDRADETYFSTDEITTGEGPQYGDPMSNDDVVDVLNDLLENTRDGGYGFLACAEEVESPTMKQLFVSRAEGCRQGEAELVQLITSLGGEPAEGGTTAGALHRGWVHVKGSLGANSDLSILESCERGEDTAIARYRKALRQNLPANVRSVVQRQAEGAQRNHDQIRDLRNAARARDEA